MKPSFYPDLFAKKTSGRLTRKLSKILFRDSGQTLLIMDDFHVSRLSDDFRMNHQLLAVYGEWLSKDGCWNFVVDKFKGARLFFLSLGSTHAELVAMAQEDYNLDMNTESVQLAYALPEAMMQRMAPDTPSIHVTVDRQVRNLLEIAKTHEVRLCVSSLSKMRAVSEVGEEDDGNEDDGDEDDGNEDANIPVVAEAVDDAGDYCEYGKVKDEDEDEEEDDDMCFVDLKGTYGSEGGRSYASRIYVNQSFASKDALVSELRLIAVRRKFSFRIYKSTKTLLVATCRVNGCGWKIRASVKHETNKFWVTKYVETHTCSVGDRITQRKHCTPKYVGRLFIDRVGLIGGLNPHHIKDAMKNMFGMTLDYTTSYRALLYAQELVRGSAEDGCFRGLPEEYVIITCNRTLSKSIKGSISCIW
ncbi:hypothetical protein F2Q69_00040920 [Brassica cretica]|uniref:Transposase MuDR plant domain-containing protein n=1 Tax=Brassica cretica TaxID=69181 RepID=A0A8S9NMD3_BRACR|nr:hypothetical protein F2Q69_00040920 [Brassica cretica]